MNNLAETIRGTALNGPPSAPRIVIIGGGQSGGAAAYTLKKRGMRPILLEAAEQVGGRLGGEKEGSFSIDTGADFFCSSYDVAFRICHELGLPLIRSKMRLGWYRKGRWITTTPGLSAGSLIRNLPAAQGLGFLSPRAVRPALKLFKEIFRQQNYLSFANDSPIADLDGTETFGEYLDRIGAPESLRVAIRGFLEMTMGDVEFSGQAYMRAYLAEMLLKADQLWVPDRGASALAHALADACADVIHVATPARRVIVGGSGGMVTGVEVDDGAIEPDAVICAISATKVPEIIPDLPDEMGQTLGSITYSSGCRVVIGMDRPPLPGGWHGALYPEDDTPLLLDRSINLPAIAPAGMSTLDLLVGRRRAEELIPLDDAEIKGRMLRDARRNPPPGSNLPCDDEGLFTRVYRWKEAVCMGPPGMFTAVADIRSRLSEEVPNLLLAGDYTAMPSVNGALASGVRAAEEAAAFLSR